MAAQIKGSDVQGSHGREGHIAHMHSSQQHTAHRTFNATCQRLIVTWMSINSKIAQTTVTTQQFYDTLWTLLKSDFQTSSGNGLFEKFYLLILLSLSTSLIGSFSAILLTSFWRALRNWSLISLNARQMNLILSKSSLIKILLSKFWCVRITHLGLFGYPPPLFWPIGTGQEHLVKRSSGRGQMAGANCHLSRVWWAGGPIQYCTMSMYNKNVSINNKP